MPAAPPAADTRKPATPPPDKTPADKASGKDTGKAAPSAAQTGQEKTPQAAPQKPAGQAPTPSQQRFDRMAVRAKLAVSEPGDAVEREADAVADQVMRMPDPPGPSAPPPKPAGAAASASKGLQRKAAPEAKPPASAEAKPAAAPVNSPEIKRKAESAPGPEATPESAHDIEQRLGAGQPLDAATRSFFEQRLHADFSAVRIHTDAAAAQTAQQLGARAFTHGQHVAFASSAYQPASEEGKRLLAHELTHVMQQQDSVTRAIMRKPAAAPASGSGGGDFEVKHAALQVPPIKARHLGAYRALAKAGNLKRKGAYDAATRGTKQGALWTDGVKPKLSKIPAAQRPNSSTGFNLQLSLAGGASTKVIKAGSEEELERLLKIPTWDASGKPVEFQVDHMVEYQLGGADEIENMELLNQTHNGSVGSSFSHGIKRTVREEIDADPKKPALKTYTGPKNAAGDPTAEGVMEAMTVVFRKVEGRARESNRKEGGSMFWSRAQIEALDHVLLLLGQSRGLDGDATRFALLSPTGNLLIAALPHAAGATKIKIAEHLSGGMAGFKMQSLTLVAGYNDLAAGANIGTLEGQFDFGPSVKMPKGKVSVAVSQAKSPGKHSGTIGTPTGEGLPNEVDFKPMSPLQLADLSLGKGVFGRATLQPSHPALAGISIPATIQDGRLGIFYTLDASTLAGKLRIPGVRIDSAGVTFGYDGSEFSVAGGTEFTIQKFGTGFLNAETNTAGDFSLEGGLRADQRLFDQADMKLWYRKKGGFGGRGTLGITTPGKIKGLKSAHLTAKYEDSVFSATGTVEPDIPGLKAASLAVTYGNDELQITGQLAIDDKVPGVEKADVNVTVKQTNDSWKVAAAGNVTPKLPGLQGALLKFSYDEGFVLLEGSFDFNKGPLSGKVTAGVTNAAVDDKGVRASTGSGSEFRVFGTAEIDAVFIKDKLSGKLKLRLLPDGNVRVGGGLKTGDFEVFPRYPADGGEFFNKSFETPEVPIPGLGFAVGPVSVGVTLSASLTATAHASIGPGRLTAIHVEIAEFDPQTVTFDTLKISGGGKFQVMGDAGFGLSAKVNLNLSAAVAALTGSVGVKADVGIPPGKPVIEAETDFTYSAAEGLDILGKLTLDISPELKFRLFGEVAAKLNLLVEKVTVWKKDFTLAEANYKLPVGIKATGSLGYNTKTGQLRPANPEQVIKVEKPSFDADTMLGIVKGDSAPAAVHTTDEAGRELTQSELNASTPAGNAGVMAQRQDPNDRTPQTVDETIVHRLGPGQPLDLATRGFFEQRLRADLSGVQLHAGREAGIEAERIGARAFTVGEHIAFAPGAYSPDTPEGRALLAHELAHVVQQQGGAARALMRAPDETPPAASAATPSSTILSAAAAPAGTTPAGPPPAAPAAAAKGPITLPSLKLPELKYGTDAANSHRKAAYDAALAANVERPAGYRRADIDSRQARIWTQATPAATLRSALATKAPGLDAGKVYVALPRSRSLASGGTQVIVGAPNELALALRQPRWDRQGQADDHPLEIDHIVELQIGGPAYDRLSNLELLERSANGASGRAIDGFMDEAFAAYAASPAAATLPAEDRNAEALKRQYRVRFGGFTVQGGPATGKRWTLAEVIAGDPAEGLRIFDPSNLTGPAPTGPGAILHPWPAAVDAARYTGSANTLVVYASARGGEPREVPLRDGQPANPATAVANLLPGMRTDAMTLTLGTSGEGPIGRISGALTHEQLGPDARIPVDIPIQRRRGLVNAGVLNTESTLGRLRNLLREGGVTGLSPVVVDEVDVLPGIGLFISGRVEPTIQMLRGASLDFQVRGEELRVSKTFNGGDIQLGGPLRIDGSDLTVGLGTRSGFIVEGGVAFSIAQLGRGTLRGAGRVGEFAVDGRFDFDPRLFDADAHIQLGYRRGADAPEGKLSGSGAITIGPGKVRGIRRASVQASFDGDSRSVAGTAELDIPGVESASLGVQFTPEGGTQISGSARFRDRPGIRNGQISATLVEASDGWHMSASGHADAAFAGISASLDASYADGLFLFAADAPFALGERVRGNVRVGVTNGQVDGEGRLVPGSAPAPGAGAGELRPFGNGSVTVRITDWLQGGVGIKVRTNGDLLISGSIGIPEPITVFDAYPPRDRATRTLFSMPTVSVPLVGVSVGSTVVGVALTINGRVTGHAQVGPGRLTQTELRVEDFNPAQPESLHVTGDAEFHLPAEAGVAASIDAGLTLGAAIINATAGINASASASLVASATPHVDLDWRAATGLALHATLDASLAPRLAFDVNGFAEVTANAFVTTFSLWRKDWNLAHREIGSSLALRLHAPVDYFSDGRGVVFDPARVQFDVPTLNADTLGQLFNEEGGSERVDREPPRPGGTVPRH